MNLYLNERSLNEQKLNDGNNTVLKIYLNKNVNRIALNFSDKFT